MRELVESIARALVDHPERVRVTQAEGAQSVLLELHVAPEDPCGAAVGGRGVSDAPGGRQQPLRPAGRPRSRRAVGRLAPFRRHVSEEAASRPQPASG